VEENLDISLYLKSSLKTSFLIKKSLASSQLCKKYKCINENLPHSQRRRQVS
jgi:hypothetical protein